MGILTNIKKWKLLFLLILPIIYFILAGTFFVNWRPFYRIGPDPVYTYLFNGITIASGKIEISYVDHPGIPVQFFAGIVIYIKYLFSHSSVVLYQDALMNPESYLYAICATISVLFVLITLLTGFYVLKYTGNLALALLFQLTPFIGKDYITAASPSPESFMLLIGVFFVAYIYCNSIFIKERPGAKISLPRIVIYGVFTGFLVACKYTCFPFFILILFVLPSLRTRIQYTGAFILFFLLFISPALPIWRNMIQWLFGLASHKGIYGSGEKGFIDMNEFFLNLKSIFTEDGWFTFLYLLLTVSLVIAYIKRKRTLPENKIYLGLLSGLWLSSSLLIFLVAKHYSFHYLIPIKLCFPLILVGSYGVWKDILKTPQNNFRYLIFFYFFLGFFIIKHLASFFQYLPQPVSDETPNFLHRYSDKPLIIASDYRSSRIEPALDFGTAYSGNFHNKYWEFLKKIYPNSYLVTPGQVGITHWDDIFYTPELFSKYPEIAVYFNDMDSNSRKSFLNSIIKWGKDTIAHCQLVYAQQGTNEYVYNIVGNQNIAKSIMDNYSEVVFDFEKFTPDKSKIISDDGKYTLDVNNSISKKEHHNQGNNSVLLTPKNQSGISFLIKAFPGNILDVTVWRKSDDDRGCIVFSSKNSSDFYTSGAAVMKYDPAGWKQIEYKCRVPSTIKDSAIKFYLWYYGTGHAYFDDLSIKTYPIKIE